MAAACAAARSRADPVAAVGLMLAPELPTGATPVFVEVVDPGEGWRDFALARYPKARFVSPDTPVLRVA